MATLTQSQSRTPSIASSKGSSIYATSPQTPLTGGTPPKGGILANAHEAPKKPIKPADNGFTAALKNAFILPTPGKQMKNTGKPLGKSFRRTSPLPTVGHEGGEVLKRDPRGQNAPVGDGVVLTTDPDDEDEESVPAWSPITATSSASSSSEAASAQESAWSGEHYGRGRSSTASTNMSRSDSIASTASSNNPCKIKFCPLPSSGRLKRANSITIGVAARTHLLQSQGSARVTDNTAAWQAQANAQKQQQSNGTNSQQGGTQDTNRGPQVRYNDTVDLGEELRKGMLKAFRKVRRGSSVSNGSEAGDEKGAPRKGVETLKEEEDYYELAGEKTPRRSYSPIHKSSDDPQREEEADGTQTPRHNLQRRTSTGAFTGNKSFLEIEERRKRGSIGETDVDREQVAHFAEQLGQTHASRVAHHTGEDRWHLREDAVDSKNNSEATSITSVESEYTDAANDAESMEAERLADESLKSHSDRATKAGGVEKMDRRH
jgi:hypothetical protein